MILVIILYALFGFSFSLGKLMVVHAYPLFAVGLRMLIGGSILLLWALTRTKPRCYPCKDDFPLYAQLIIFAIFIPYVFRLWALQEVASSKAALLFNTSPFFSALFARFFLKERINLIQGIGLFIGFGGTIPILLTSSPAEDAFSWGFLSIYELAIILAAASMSYGFIVTQRLVKDRKCPAYLVNGVATLGGGFLAFNASWFFEPVPIKTSFTALLGVMVLQIIVSNLICSNLQANLLKTYSSTFLAFAGFLSPIFASIYGVMLFSETISWHFLASFVLVIVGIGLFTYGEQKKKLSVPPVKFPPSYSKEGAVVQKQPSKTS
ncbi:TPA: hypothetical protein DDZ86_04810 [Candidatus Dependentiae bacterium]|nr:MAG: hypothetical protein A2Y17_09615 [Clostridiales bacterium GWF2_38_85]HBL98933.1 hypothetical protein [Candidatus Dependentiae bacterium]